MADNFYSTYQPNSATVGGVSSLNALTGALTLIGGSGITITPAGSNITIASSAIAGATVALDNLVSTAVNADINPGLNNIVNLGSAALNYVKVNTAQVFSLGTTTKTANTHTSSTIDNISSTADLILGMSVNGSGVPHDTIIASIAANSITLTSATNGGSVSTLSSLTGTTITFINPMLIRSTDNSTNSSAIDTGEVVTRSGDLTGTSTVSNTGFTLMRSGDITNAGSSGATGALTGRSGNNSGSGNSGALLHRSGTVTSGTSGSHNVTTGTATTGASGSLTLGTGSVSAGTGNSGNITVQPGASAGGTRGKIILSDASTPTTIGFVWTATATNGSGTWQAASAGANTTLSNLGVTAINADLLPSANNTRSLGAAGNKWNTLFLNAAEDDSSFAQIDFVNRSLIAVDAGPSPNTSIDWQNRVLKDRTTATKMDWSGSGSIDMKQSVLNNIVVQSGNTASRPAGPVVGQTYFDTTLAAGNGKPIWWSSSGGGQWVDAAGLPA